MLKDNLFNFRVIFAAFIDCLSRSPHEYSADIIKNDTSV